MLTHAFVTSPSPRCCFRELLPHLNQALRSEILTYVALCVRGLVLGQRRADVRSPPNLSRHRYVTSGILRGLAYASRKPGHTDTHSRGRKYNLIRIARAYQRWQRPTWLRCDSRLLYLLGRCWCPRPRRQRHWATNAGWVRERRVGRCQLARQVQPVSPAFWREGWPRLT